MSNEFNVQNTVNYWIESSDEDYNTMLDLFQTRNFGWSLFLGHLVIEKLLKAYYTKTLNEYPPMIHDLRRIGERAGIEFDENKLIMIETISQFNIRARYDDFRRNFQRLCTPEYSATWIENIKELRLWIKTML